MAEWESRTLKLIGSQACDVLHASRVAVFGIGGVGGYVCEALARAGVGRLTLIDSDVVDATNINRQIIALADTVGRGKTELMAERIGRINGDCRVDTVNSFYLPENSAAIDLGSFDYIADAVDTVAAKIELAVRAAEAGTEIISCMGTGNKLHPELLEIADIYDTSICPLARVMRRELKKRNIAGLKVVYSKEPPVVTGRVPASISFVPSAAGLIMAGEIIRDLIRNREV